MAGLSSASLNHPQYLAKQVFSKYFPIKRLKYKVCMEGSICPWTQCPLCTITVDLPVNNYG